MIVALLLLNRLKPVVKLVAEVFTCLASSFSIRQAMLTANLAPV